MLPLPLNVKAGIVLTCWVGCRGTAEYTESCSYVDFPSLAFSSNNPNGRDEGVERGNFTGALLEGVDRAKPLCQTKKKAFMGAAKFPHAKFPQAKFPAFYAHSLDSVFEGWLVQVCYKEVLN